MMSEEKNSEEERTTRIRPPNTCSAILPVLKPFGSLLDVFVRPTRPIIDPRDQLQFQRLHKDIPEPGRDQLSIPCFLLMSDQASTDLSRYAELVWPQFPILSMEDAESNLRSFRDGSSGETAQDDRSVLLCSHTRCTCGGITIPADTVNACTLLILSLGELCSPSQMTTISACTDVRIQAARYILYLNDGEVSLSNATAYTLTAQLMDRLGHIVQRDRYVTNAIWTVRHLLNSTSRSNLSRSEGFYFNCMIWTLVRMEMESTHVTPNWYDGKDRLRGGIENCAEALDLFSAKTQLWQVMKDFQDCESGHPHLQRTYRMKLEDWRQSLGLSQWKDDDTTSDPAAAHLHSEYWWATIHGSLPLDGSVDASSEDGLRAIDATLQFFIVYRSIKPSYIPNPGTILKRYLLAFTLLQTDGLLCTTGIFSVCSFSLPCSDKDLSLEI